MEIYSTSKALYHVSRLNLLQQNKPIAPTLLQVDLEAYCNDNCSFCSYRKEDGYNNTMLKLLNINPNDRLDENKPIGKPSTQSRLPFEFATKLPEMMVDANIPAIELTGGGEPTLWAKFDELILNIEKYGIELGLVTNGSNLNDERIKILARHASWVRFSMDSSNQEMHKTIHRTPNDDFQRRIEHLKLMGKTKDSKLILGISFIITPSNVNDIQDAIELYKSILGVNNIRFSWMYDKTGMAGLDYDTIEMIKSNLEKFKTKYDTKDFRVLFERGRIETYSQPNDDFKKCYYQHFVWNIGADALVYPCCIMKYHPEFALADIRKMTLKQIIEDQYVHNKMTSLNPKGCFPCWLRNRNKDIAKAVEKPEHVNFV